MIKKFNESPDVAVFTTRFVIEDHEPVIKVVHHDDDGSWEFTGGTQGSADADYRVIALHEMIERDPSLLEVADLPSGGKAFREAKGDPWKIY